MENDSIQVQYLTSSQIVSRSPVKIISVLHRSAAGGAGVSTFYDGVDSSSNVLFPVTSAASLSFIFNPPVPVTTKKGLYISLDSNTASVLVIFSIL